MSLHLNLIVTHPISRRTLMGYSFFLIIVCKSRRPGGCLPSQRQPLVTHKKLPYKAKFLFLGSIELTFLLPQMQVIHTALHLTYRVAIISTYQDTPPHPSHPALISRQNVSLAAVLERRALNFEFSYTFPLNGMARQIGRKKERNKAWEKVPVEGWSLGPRGRVSRGRSKVC